MIAALLFVLLSPAPDAPALNPAVGQATIHQTICKPGWTTSIRPPSSYTTKIKLQQLRARGLAGKAADYEEDHKMPLDLGGHPTDVRNLEPQPLAEAKRKDVLEHRIVKLVCAGKLTLVQGQSAFGDWRAAYAQYVGKLP